MIFISVSTLCCDCHARRTSRSTCIARHAGVVKALLSSFLDSNDCSDKRRRVDNNKDVDKHGKRTIVVVGIEAAKDTGTRVARIAYYNSAILQTLGRLISADKTDFDDWTVQKIQRLSTQTMQEHAFLGTNQFQDMEQQDMFNQDPGGKNVGPSHASSLGTCSLW